VIPTPTIKYSSPSNTAVLTFNPSLNATGTVTVTLTVNDGSKSNNLVHQTFTVMVMASPPGTNSVSASGGVSSGAATLTTVVQAGGQFSFQVAGVSGGKYVVQVTSDLIHWTSVQTNTSPFTFQDSTANGYSQRFYRAGYIPSN